MTATLVMNPICMDKSVRHKGAVPAPQAGVVLARTLAYDPNQEYFLYVPRTGGAGAPVFVTVHGINRNAKEHAHVFAPMAERHGVVLIAPLFPEERFRDYQRLGRKGKGERADCALDRILGEVGSLTGADIRKAYMFGYSGGAQFAHRFAMAHPQRVARIVLAAAGWYTFPDPTVEYPWGIKPTPDLPDGRVNPAAFLSVPTCVLVGEKDVERGPNLRTSRRVDRQQGTTRLERAKRWMRAVAAAAKLYQVETPYILQVLPRTGHTFESYLKRGEMGRRVFKFLFGPS